MFVEKETDFALASRLRDFAAEGNTVILMLRPGIEAAWPQSQDASVMEELLPSRPYAVQGTTGVMSFLPAAGARLEPSMALLGDGKALQGLRAHRIVPMNVADSKSTLMLVGGAVGDARAPVDREGLLYVRRVGAGRVFTFAAIPDAMNTNLGTHPMFLPMLVSASLRPAEASRASNVQAGQPLVLRAGNDRQIELHAPEGEVFEVIARDGQFSFAKTSKPGIYRWMRPGAKEPRAIAEVSLPAEESQAIYRAADTLIPSSEQVLLARSLDEMNSRVAQISQPQPRWTMPLALVMLLLCCEAAISTTQRWPAWIARWMDR